MLQWESVRLSSKTNGINSIQRTQCAQWAIQRQINWMKNKLLISSHLERISIAKANSMHYWFGGARPAYRYPPFLPFSDVGPNFIFHLLRSQNRHKIIFMHFVKVYLHGSNMCDISSLVAKMRYNCPFVSTIWWIEKQYKMENVWHGQ